MYNCIEITSENHDIMAQLYDKVDKKNPLTSLDPEAKSDTTWKKMQWGTTFIDDVYCNFHRGTIGVPSAIMLSVKTDGNIASWIKRVSKQYPDLDFSLEYDVNEDEHYVKAKYKGGKKIPLQETLF